MYSYFIHIDLNRKLVRMELSIRNVNKTYGNGVKAINDISLEISSGMFGLLGPNGAGKSSLMRTIVTLQLPDSGELLFNGEDIFIKKTDFRMQLGYLPQEFDVYPRESASSLLNYFAILKGISSKKERILMVDKVLEITNLQDVKDKRVSTFSGGMKQRFGIAQLLLNQPKVVVVDEPTAGLDPAERTRFLNVLRNIGSENIVLFSTHLVDDVNGLCKEMAVMDEGRLLARINPQNALEKLKGKIWETEMSPPEMAASSDLYIKLSDRYNNMNRLVTRIYAEQSFSERWTVVNPKLEDFYFLTLYRK